jgi:hypothetical protein
VYLDGPLVLTGDDLAASEDAKVLPVLFGIKKESRFYMANILEVLGSSYAAE